MTEEAVSFIYRAVYKSETTSPLTRHLQINTWTDADSAVLYCIYFYFTKSSTYSAVNTLLLKREGLHFFDLWQQLNTTSVIVMGTS